MVSPLGWLGRTVPATHHTSTEQMRIALFVPCFNDLLFPGSGQATVRMLERLGHEVVFPDGQTCCGQIHFNTGLSGRGHAARPPLRPSLCRIRRRRHAVAVLRGHGPPHHATVVAHAVEARWTPGSTRPSVADVAPASTT